VLVRAAAPATGLATDLRWQSLSVVGSVFQPDPGWLARVASIRAALAAGGPALCQVVARPWRFGSLYLQHGTGQLDALPEPQTLAAVLDAMLASGDERKWLRAITCPVLAMVGSEDVFTPMRHSHEVVEWVKHGVLVTITGAGHHAALEKPQEFLRVFAGFLERSHEFVSGPDDWADGDGDDGADGGEDVDYDELFGDKY
jgi:pimeloyl-ACP methyl ester carboxylesterase